jgi:hypothetical protein
LQECYPAGASENVIQQQDGYLMSTMIEKHVPILVEISRDERSSGGERYRLWDSSHAIPGPRAGIIRAEILVDGTWEEMHYNTVWGKQLDPKKRGTWLKQKANRYFSSEIGNRSFQVRYFVAAE